LALEGSEQRATLEAALLLGLVQGALALGPRRSWLGLVRRACSAPELSGGEGPSTKYSRPFFARWDARAGGVPGTTCLGRALTGWIMLRRRRIPAVVRLGVTLAAAEPFGAHAWLECQGRAVVGAPEPERYTTMPEPRAG